MESTDDGSRIKDFSEDEHPVEQLYEYDPHVLTTSQLIALIIRTGASNASAAQLAEQLLEKYDGNLKEMAKQTAEDIKKGIKGLGKNKAALIVAALELGKRLAKYLEEKPQISAPADVARILMPSLRDLKQEVLHVLCLDTKNNVTNQRQIFEGSLNVNIIHPREVFRFAIEESSASIILVHNHPSGDPSPSKEDIRATKQLIEAGNCIQIPVLDHIIIGDGSYVSLKEEGLI